MRARPYLVAMAAAVMLMVCWVARAQSPPADLRGIYVDSNEISRITDRNASALAASLNVPGVDGLVLVIGRAALEPAMGQYRWTVLDQWMSRAVSSGKKVELSVIAGIDTPSWLSQPAPGGAGATPLSFSAARKNGKKGICEAETIAAPWDATFLAQWDALLAALSAHLKSVGTYSDVALLRLTGINRDTDELHLPAEEDFGATGQGAACGGTVNSPTPYTSATYLAMLQTGIYPLGRTNRLRAQYLEVFAANVNAFPDETQQAHLELLAPPPP